MNKHVVVALGSEIGMQALRLAFRCGYVPLRTRFMALGSILCMLYFSFMTFTITTLSWFEILPNLYQRDYDAIAWHKYAVAFTFINAVGNCSLVLGTNTSIKRLGKESRENVKRLKDSKKCEVCDIIVPTRTHHCYLCESCILKRDHHCFFMTVCIGYYNHKYFIMYCFYMMIGTFYGLILIVMYLKMLYNLKFYGPQTFITILVELVLGMMNGNFASDKYFFLVVMMYGCLSAGIIAASLWFWQMLILLSGQTTYEANRGITRHTDKTVIDNFLEVFGKYWIINLFLPLPFSLSSEGLLNYKSHICKQD